MVATLPERGLATGLNVLPIPADYQLGEQYAQYAAIAQYAPHVRVDRPAGYSVIDKFPQHSINLVSESLYVAANAFINPFALKGIQDATAVIAGIYLAEREVGYATSVDFPPDIQQAVDQNAMRTALSREVMQRVARAAQSLNRHDLRRLIIVDFLREIGEKQAHMLEGKFGGWERAIDDYRCGLAIVLRRWQSISSEA